MKARRIVYFNPNYLVDWVETFDKHGVPEGLTDVAVSVPSLEQYLRFYKGFTELGLHVFPWAWFSPNLDDVDPDLYERNRRAAGIRAWADPLTWERKVAWLKQIAELPRSRNIIAYDMEPGVLRVKEPPYDGEPSRGDWRDLRIAMSPFLAAIAATGAEAWVYPGRFETYCTFIIDAAGKGVRLLGDYNYLEPLKEGERKTSYGGGHTMTELREKVSVPGNVKHGLWASRYYETLNRGIPLWFYASREMRENFGKPERNQ